MALSIRCGQVFFATGKLGLARLAEILIFGAFFREGIAGYKLGLLAQGGLAAAGTLHVADGKGGAPRAKNIFLHSQNLLYSWGYAADAGLCAPEARESIPDYGMPGR
jgi:hypothetical protein